MSIDFMELLIAIHFELKYQEQCQEDALDGLEPLRRQYPIGAVCYFEGPGGLERLSVVERELVRQSAERREALIEWAYRGRDEKE